MSTRSTLPGRIPNPLRRTTITLSAIISTTATASRTGITTIVTGITIPGTDRTIMVRASIPGTALITDMTAGAARGMIPSGRIMVGRAHSVFTMAVHGIMDGVETTITGTARTTDGTLMAWPIVGMVMAWATGEVIGITTDIPEPLS